MELTVFTELLCKPRNMGGRNGTSEEREERTKWGTDQVGNGTSGERNKWGTEQVGNGRNGTSGERLVRLRQ
jgi:hypothetical protein